MRTGLSLLEAECRDGLVVQRHVWSILAPLTELIVGTHQRFLSDFDCTDPKEAGP